MTSGKRVSGLYLQVISLYRQALRTAHLKRSQGYPGQPWAAYAREEFDKHRGLSHTNIQLVEYLVRQGAKRLQLVSRPEVTSIAPTGTTTQAMNQARQGASGSTGSGTSTRHEA